MDQWLVDRDSIREYLIRLVGPSKRLETREILLFQKSVSSLLLLDLNMLLPAGQRIPYVS